MMEAPVVNPRLKETLMRNKMILLKNIVFCEGLYTEMDKLNVFPERIVNEIKSADKLEDKVDKMVETLSLKGKSTVLKFCDALQLSGHSFLADILREELEEKPADPIDLLEMMKHLPNNRLGKHWKDFKEEELAEVGKYINEKVRENVVKQLWMRDSQDKVKAMDAKQKQLEDSWVFTEQIKSLQQEIDELKGNVKLARRELEHKDDQIAQYSRLVHELKSSHQNEMETQMKYNVANDKSVQRVNEQLTETEQVVLEMKILMKEYFHEMEPENHLRRRDSDAFYKDRSITTADKAKDLLELMMERVQNLEKTERQFWELNSEKKIVLRKMGAKETASLLSSFEGFVKGHEDKVGDLMRQRQRLADRVEEQLAVNDSASNQMNDTLTQLHAEMSAKDAQVKTLKDELMRLRTVMAFQDKKKQDKRPTTPRFKNYQEPIRPETQAEPEAPVVPTPRGIQKTNPQPQVTDPTPAKINTSVDVASPSPISVERRMVAYPGAEGQLQRPQVRLALSRPTTQHNVVKPAASYPQPNNSMTLPPLTSSQLTVYSTKGAAVPPKSRGEARPVDLFTRGKTLMPDTVAKSSRRPGAREMTSMQRKDSMTGYVSNGNTYKVSYRYG